MLPPSKRSLALGLATTGSLVAAGPCDIYDAGGTPCVAAHSTTRALYSAYDGELYQVTRASDNTTTVIKPRTAGGAANAATQDTFCDDTTCAITVIYDQSGRGNHLTPAPPGGAASGAGFGGHDLPSVATDAPVYLDGNKVYGVYINPGNGYRIDITNGVARGDEPESIYDVVDGTHYNGECCFDYGNAEKNNTDNGAGHMEVSSCSPETHGHRLTSPPAVYFGSETTWGTGSGPGPWVMADLEDGLFSGYNASYNPGDPTQTARFVTGMVKGEPDYWELKGGNAASGSLSTYYAGIRPAGYATLHKEGSIILGIGGDNSNSAEGTWYEGVLTYGFASDTVDEEVQANIVAAKYSTTA